MRLFIPPVSHTVAHDVLAQRTINDPVLLAPLALFVVVSVAQLVIGLATIRRGGRLTAAAGLAGTAFGGLTALTVLRDPEFGGTGGDLLSGTLPTLVPWYGLLAVVAAGLSTVAAFRLWARAYAIVPVLTGLGFLTWFYGWLI